MKNFNFNILHITGGNLTGGASHAAYVLHSALYEKNINSNFLIHENSKKSPGNIHIAKNIFPEKVFFNTRLNRNIVKLFSPKEYFTFDVFGYDITKSHLYHNADIIHCHWINDGIIALQSLPKIKKPIFWTFHDMWPFTGGCHYAFNCKNYESSCGSCKILNRSFQYDISRILFLLKQNAYPLQQMNVFAVSNWLKECAQNSSLFKSSNITTIHNGLDIKKYFSIPKDMARTKLKIHNSKKIILTGAQRLDLPWKGMELFIQAVNEIPLTERVLIVIFGLKGEKYKQKINHNTMYLDYINDYEALRNLYSAADVFVAPSLQEAFGQTLVESMACETPVVCFDATGPKDIIDHQLNGYKAQPFDPNDLAAGILWVLKNNDPQNKLGREARKKVINKFNIDNCADQYIELYKTVLLKTIMA